MAAASMHEAGHRGRAPEEDPPVVENLGPLLPFLLIILFFYFVLVRPQKARQREALRMQEQIAPGQQVMTTSGLYATVAAIEDDAVILETSPGVTSKWARPAIARVVDPLDAPAGGVELRKNKRKGSSNGSDGESTAEA
jgi:preprotein translocase subunit YajC